MKLRNEVIVSIEHTVVVVMQAESMSVNEIAQLSKQCAERSLVRLDGYLHSFVVTDIVADNNTLLTVSLTRIQK